MERFEGKIAIVTGAASGVGRATTHRLASEGATVFGVDMNEDGATFQHGLELRALGRERRDGDRLGRLGDRR